MVSAEPLFFVDAPEHWATNSALRALQENRDRGRTILTILYLVVLSLCCMTPVIYYIRLYIDEWRNRRRHADLLELRGQQTAAERLERRAAHRKFLQERRARILQLFTPVRTTLVEDNFPYRQPPSAPITEKEDEKPTSDDDCTDVDDNDGDDNDSGTERMEDEECGEADVPDDDDLVIRIPAPGLFWDVENPKYRQAPGMCTICLSTYTLGSEVVWSSNEACEHVFHADCIERWLLKQREGPWCPCCRREFIVDPYEVVDEIHDDNADEEAPNPENVTPSNSENNDDTPAPSPAEESSTPTSAAGGQ